MFGLPAPSPDGFAGVDGSAISNELKKSDANRRKAVADARKKFPKGMIQGDRIIEKRNGEFVVVGELDKGTLDAGLQTPTRRKSGGSQNSGGQSNSVTRFKGQNYNMEDPAQVKQYRTRQAAEIKDTQERTGNRMADLRGGGGYNPDAPNNRNPDPVTTRDRSGGGTQTGPNKGNLPTDWAQYEAFLNKKGIELANSRKENIPFKGIDLPSQSKPITAETMQQQNGAYNDAIYGDKVKQVDFTVPDVKGAGTGYADRYREMSYGMDPQSGASSLPDQMDQSRAIEGEGKPTAEKRRRPSGARQGEMFDRQNPRFQAEDNTPEPMESAISARSRAFLDAPMGVGPMGVMRRTNAAQNIMRVDGKIGIKGADGNVTEISQEGYDAIRSGQRNATEFKDDFLKQYTTTPSTPKEAQSADSQAPVAASEDLAKFVQPAGTEIPVSAIQQNVTYFENDREPLMRFPKKDMGLSKSYLQ